MESLLQSRCEPCRGGVSPMTRAEAEASLREIPGWKVREQDGILRLEREFGFRDFREALDFTVKVGELAEREQHHPDLHLSWGKVRMETWTHKIKGLHRNDFILAAKASRLHTGAPGA